MKNELIEYFKHNGLLVCVVYKAGNQFIATEKRSSMGFQSYEGAVQWLAFVCRDARPLTRYDNCFKMIPDNVKRQIPENII